MENKTFKTYDEMDEWEKMECRLGKYLTGKIIDGKIYYNMSL